MPNTTVKELLTKIQENSFFRHAEDCPEDTQYTYDLTVDALSGAVREIEGATEDGGHQSYTYLVCPEDGPSYLAVEIEGY